MSQESQVNKDSLLKKTNLKLKVALNFSAYLAMYMACSPLYVSEVLSLSLLANTALYYISFNQQVMMHFITKMIPISHM